MGDDVQDTECALSTVGSSRRRLVSTPSTLAGQGAARRAHEAHPGSLQLLRHQRQLSKSASVCRRGEAGLVQVASPSEPATAPHLGDVRQAVAALSSPTSPYHDPNLGDVATSQLSGRAGWWKSPCPDLARAPGAEASGATRQRRASARGWPHVRSGRDGPFGPPPGQNPACRFSAPGSRLRSTGQRNVCSARSARSAERGSG